MVEMETNESKIKQVWNGFFEMMLVEKEAETILRIEIERLGEKLKQNNQLY